MRACHAEGFIDSDLGDPNSKDTVFAESKTFRFKDIKNQLIIRLYRSSWDSYLVSAEYSALFQFIL